MNKCNAVKHSSMTRPLLKMNLAKQDKDIETVSKLNRTAINIHANWSVAFSGCNNVHSFGCQPFRIVYAEVDRVRVPLASKDNRSKLIFGDNSFVV